MNLKEICEAALGAYKEGEDFFTYVYPTGAELYFYKGHLKLIRDDNGVYHEFSKNMTLIESDEEEDELE